MGELYGEVNKLTMEWKDGLMAVSVRHSVQVNYCTGCLVFDKSETKILSTNETLLYFEHLSDLKENFTKQLRINKDA